MLRYTQSTLSHLERFSRGWKPGETIRILDVATGSGDVPRAILKWAKRKSFDVRVVGIDLHTMTARAAGADDVVRIVQADAMHLPFGDGSFDYATTSLFLHHLDEADVVTVLAEMGRVIGRGVIVGDLLRHRRAYFWVNVLTSLANPMVRHDGRISVAQAFKRGDRKLPIAGDFVRGLPPPFRPSLRPRRREAACAETRMTKSKSREVAKAKEEAKNPKKEARSQKIRS